MKIAVSTAAGWSEEHAGTLNRLLAELDVAPTVLTSTKRESGYVWGSRALEWASKQKEDVPVCLLTDDVKVPPGFSRAVQAAWAAADRVWGNRGALSLHTSVRGADEVRRSTSHRFVLTDWVTTSGWVLWPSVAQCILHHLTNHPRAEELRRKPLDNAIQAAIQDIWSRPPAGPLLAGERPLFASTIPALVQRRSPGPSCENPTVGARAASVPWTDEDLAPPEGKGLISWEGGPSFARIHDPAWWRQNVDPPVLPAGRGGTLELPR